MKYTRSTQFSMVAVIGIFFIQAFLVWRLFQVNRNFLKKQIDFICQEAYVIDMNARLMSLGKFTQPRISIEKFTQKRDRNYNLDNMTDVDKSNSVTLINIAIDNYLAKERPLRLSSIDSVITILMKKENIHSPFYSQIVDLKNRKILSTTKHESRSSFFSAFQIRSNSIPLDFKKTKGFQLVLYNPLLNIFSQMILMLVLSFVLSFLCINSFRKQQKLFAKQKILAQSKSDFFNHISHELRRPVAVLHIAIDSLLNKDVVNNKERREKYLKTSMKEIEGLNSKIDMILTMSMDEEGMFQLKKSEFNVVDLIHELENRFKMLESKPIKIFIEDNLSQKNIMADKNHLLQCISNLIENAIKYSGDSVDIKVKLTSEKGFLSLSVSDNGIGIKEENLKFVFEKFARVEESKKVNGYGIGLSYVKQIAEKHGGSVFVKSEFGNGSEFTMRLPVNL